MHFPTKICTAIGFALFASTACAQHSGPVNYQLPPHTHPAVERVTVLSGTFHMGMGEK